MFGSGVGVVLLKPLADALRDGDPIRAVIRGSAVNNDGSLKAGFAAPGLEGQASVIASALRAAALDPDQISYIEAHGTGTGLGDPVELAALTRVFGSVTGRRITLGAVKGHVGHLETAAGVTGLIKTVLALEAEVLPPTLHYTVPNLDLGLAATPFEIDANARPWPRSAQPRRAGVSSFGMGGTNVHAVLEEAPLATTAATTTAATNRPELILLSARNPAALARIGQRLAAFVRAQPDLAMADVAHTLATGRRAFEWRRAVVAHDAESLKAALNATDNPPRQAADVPSISPDRTAPQPSGDGGDDDRRALLRQVGANWCGGGRIEAVALNGNPSPRRVELPTYPFQRSRYWHAMENAAPVIAPQVVAPPVEAPASVLTPIQVDIPAAVAEIVALALLIPASKLDGGRSFIDLGADSLVLIEINQNLKRRFGVAVTVAEMFETLTDTNRLARHVAAKAAPMAQRPPALAPALALPARVVTPDTAVKPVIKAEPPLDRQKQAHLDGLIAVYTARTARSKQLARDKRPILADTRSAAGFKMYLKEMLYPIIVDRGEGAHVIDMDGNRYVDVTMGFGCRLFGHDAGFMRHAMQGQLDRDAPLGPENPHSGRVADVLTRLTGADRIGIFSTGTEAVMTALRVARAKAGRDGIALFKGSYHGHADLVLGIGLEGGQVAPLSIGVPADVVEKLTMLDYGPDYADDAALQMIEAKAGTLAAVLVEPVQSRFPDRQPGPFLHKLRALCDRLEIALIFDEMITGFRIGAGGAQRWFGVQADLVTYGKIVGNGLPIGVVAGKADWLDYLDGGAWGFGDQTAPVRPSIFYAGTFNKNPWTMAAAAAVLEEIEARGPSLYSALNMKTARLACRLNAFFAAAGFPIEVVHFASLFRFRIASNADLFFLHLNLRGIYVWEGRNCFLSDAHTDADIDAICRAAEAAALALREGGFLDPAPAREDAVPLTRAQAQLLVAEARVANAAQAYTIPLVVEISGGTLDLSRDS